MSGWTTVTVVPEVNFEVNPYEDPMAKVKECSECGHEHEEERENVPEWLKEEAENSYARQEGRDSLYFVFGGYSNFSDDVERVQRILGPLSEDVYKVVIVQANDTSDSGVGRVYELDDGELKLLDEYKGYGGARAEDVAGMVNEDYGFRPAVTWEGY